MIINKKLLKNLDYSIALSMIIIVLIGITTIASATIITTSDGISMSALKSTAFQIMYFIVAMILGFVILTIDYNTIGSYYKLLYIVSIFLLILVLAVGSVRNNAKCWLGIGPFGIQPSEFAKLTTIITISKLMEEMDNINKPKNLLKLALTALIPMGLIQLQPDTGTNIIFFMTILGMLFIAGLDLRFIYGGAATAVVSIVAIWKLNILKPYQKDRILVFLRPETDKLGKGYNALLAKTAIASGKFFGTGWGGGLTNGKFIPESHTDFIFCVFAEKWGFLGAMILLALYLNIVLRSITIAKTSKDKFGFYVITGIVTMFLFQIFQNIGMDIGLMPITGIPLPLVSYGGSSLLTSVVSIALILNIGMRRQKINF
ncbi:rod shape-determining protein RodA [Caloramator sp. E03]|uniref:rod shape-determining protein RodA n=1 Tax=Caloramator sp. E03 TaxID=2576307 RepID=UPI001110CA2C|nr:rod shape-determining protein RodA [Caloramator sp. E03]QCX32486.1 rod shape-determining protein RodA [Caloramator sp. E03]